MLERLLVERIEHRILVGTIAFLGIMVLVGWIAINEGGRMQAFDVQYTARAIERGASLFNSNCTSCHGSDGRGLTGVAPGLNSPYLFGHDYLAEVDAQIAAVDPGNPTQLCDATTDVGAAVTDQAVLDLCTQRNNLIAQMQPAITLGYNPEAPSRLANVGWSSTLHNFTYTTLISGRPTSTSYWPQPMAAWSQTAGGPLRNDQIEDLTQYILNWDREWTVDDLLAVNQFQRVPVDSALAQAGGSGEPVIGIETEIAAIMEGLASVTGNPQDGEALYGGVAYGCSGCHNGGVVGPATEGTWTRVQEERLTLPEFEGYTGEQYLAESIIHPGNYIVQPYQAGLMPATFGNSMSYQQLADIIEYLKTQDQPLS